MPYCTAQDLLLGDLATSSIQNPGQFVSDAGDEIDQTLGVKYVTPINVNALSHPAQLTLKRINVYLATGGFMVNAARGDTNVHATGLMYMKQARESLMQLANGDYILEGATPNGNIAVQDDGLGVRNVDSYSYVENYYTNGRARPGETVYGWLI